MKKLFFLVSALGAMYLFYQAIGANVFSFGPQDTVVGTSEQSNEIQTELEVLTNELSALKNRNVQLSQDLARSEQDNKALRETLLAKREDEAIQPVQAQTNELLGPERNVEQMLAKASQPIAPVALPDTTTPGAFAVLDEPASNLESEQQKRLRQQAQLRDIAQRMQLAAIDALQSK
ncbi:hypothetical protein KJ365_00840 [Glaciecola sp. XM2]|uniref:hypothetical protein n=1 Tax=Glaciecola sp. XM2 TaxID=1914931 RepID=UPI001BDEAEE9|nr:hypothetical protein [Glaciecola sp. XM2]MBT1449413.1 hypothetical protein [Glaciecola sp. XM2]